ncbi:hypothetical protein OAL13_00115 [bacterium]|nr:hypothetical protein [bacterium]
MLRAFRLTTTSTSTSKPMNEPQTPQEELLMSLQILEEFGQEMEQATEDFHSITTRMLPKLIELVEQI